jgi:hypothetical protein
MINQVNSQPMISCPQMNMPKQEAKNIIISSSLMMMLLEWASKQGDNDIVLHQALENIMSFNDGINPLKIDVFNCIVPEDTKYEPSEVPEDWSDIEGGECVKAFTDGFNLANQEECEALPCSDTQDECCASEMGACLANAGVDLSAVPYSNVSSNAEIESFWDGYESINPMEITCGEEPCCPMNCEEVVDDDLQTEIDNIINSCIG